jgi:hypothetical protein
MEFGAWSSEKKPEIKLYKLNLENRNKIRRNETTKPQERNK